MTPAERARRDPHFAQLVHFFYRQYIQCDQQGAGLTPTEVREAAALAWQQYSERNLPLLVLRDPFRDPPENVR